MSAPRDVLFLCTGNSARSILAECILRRVGGDRFRAWSAGSQPRGEVHPEALRLLRAFDYDTTGLRSKSWDELAVAGAPRLDFVFTVCDSAREERCPVWPGQPMTAHWGVPDPAAAPVEDQETAFRQAYFALERRIRLFCDLPFDALGRVALQHELDTIGKDGMPAVRRSDQER